MMKLQKLSSTLLIVLALLFHTLGVAAQDGTPEGEPQGGSNDGSIGDVTDAPQAVTPADVNVQAAGGGYLYALQDVGTGNQIYGFQVNELTGALTALGGFPVATGGNGGGGAYSEMMAYDAAQSRLYVINNGSDTVSAYSVNQTTGALTALPFSPVSLGAGGWSCVAVHPSGSPLVVGEGSGSQIASFNITGSSATAAAGSPFSTGAAFPFSCAFSRDGAYVYTGGNLGTSIAGFSVNASTGVLTALPGSPFNSGGSYPLAYATDSVGRLFAANISANQVRVFTTSGGVPSPVLGNPFTSGLTEAIHGVIHPSGYYLVADRSGNRVGVYRINGSGSSTTLAAVAGSPFAAGGSFTDILALNQSGAFLFAANGDTRNITTFSVNAGTGALLNANTQITNTLGTTGRITGMSYAPQPQLAAPLGSGFVYALDEIATGNQIYGYQVNELTGALTALAGFPLGTGGNGDATAHTERMAYDAVNSRLYVINAGSATVSAYSLNRTTGTLTAMPFNSIGLPSGSWSCLAVHPNGSPLVVGNESGNLASFNITASSAITATGSPYTTGGASPFSCAFSRDGAYVYAGGQAAPTTFAGFSVNASTGVLTALPGSPFNSGAGNPVAYVTDDSGRLFVSNATANQVRVFTTSGGVPSPVLGNPFTAGLIQGVHGVRHPAGYYLVADWFGNRVGVYRINGSGPSTTLTAVSGSPFGSGGSFTGILALNRAGTLLFAANGTSRNLTTYAVDGATGALNGVGIQPVDTLGSAGFISGLAYAPGLNYTFLPLILKQP